uniref:Uncharacterized protein n=1 Tax=Gopherus agassizii TaxID=38772 RepID=A0A452I5K2_9SAUR
MVGTSGAFRNDLLTPDVRFTTISCLGFTTGIPEREGSTVNCPIPPLSTTASVNRGVRLVCARPLPSSPQGTLTRGHQLGFVLLIPHLLLLHAAAGEEEAHHPVEELVRELDGQGHHVHLQEEPFVRGQPCNPWAALHHPDTQAGWVRLPCCLQQLLLGTQRSRTPVPGSHL